jgi:hypothetical protein
MCLKVDRRRDFVGDEKPNTKVALFLRDKGRLGTRFMVLLSLLTDPKWGKRGYVIWVQEPQGQDIWVMQTGS